MRIRLSAAARQDISGIWTYSAKRWDKAQADRYVRAIMDSLDCLSGDIAKWRNANEVRADYFKLVVGSHVVFYRSRTVNVIEVVRILHQRMDFDRHL